MASELEQGRLWLERLVAVLTASALAGDLFE
jgi:hypothetical protein